MEREAQRAQAIATDARILSAAEVRLAAELTAGRADAEIATSLALAPEGVARDIERLCRKLGVTTRTELAVLLGALRVASSTSVDVDDRDAAQPMPAEARSDAAQGASEGSTPGRPGVA